MKTKNVTLYNPHNTNPSSSNVWYARFRVKVHDPSRGIVTIQRNLSTLLAATESNRRQAQKIANDRRDEALKAFWADANGKAPLKLRDTTPTCGQILDIFLKHSASAYARQVGDVFLTVVAEGVGRWIDQRERARDVRLSALTKSAMIAFRDQVARKAAGLPIKLNAVSINTYMRQAKSVFSRKAREHYLHLTIPPTIRDWAETSTLDENHYEQKFIAIESYMLEAADAASHQMLEFSKTYEADGRMTLARRWKNAYGCYLLMRYCGLRNIEVENLRWEWFTARPDGEFMVNVIKRDYWKGPKKTSGSTPMHHELYAELLELFGPARPGSDGFVLCGTMTDRKEGTHRVPQGFMRRYISRGSKNLYCLRKQYATEMEDHYDLKTSSAVLRHDEGDTTTARDHYVDGNVKLNRVKPLWRS
jgi:hypothetical protein